jgi:hypothetical protein
MDLLDNEFEVARLRKESEKADLRGRSFTAGLLRAEAYEMDMRIKEREMPKAKPERNAELASAYLNGASTYELAAQYGISQPRVWFILDRERARGCRDDEEMTERRPLDAPRPK